MKILFEDNHIIAVEKPAGVLSQADGGDASDMVNLLKEDIKERWVYYCCYPYEGYSNRFMAMHSARTRFLGVQMYKYGL